MSNHGLSNRAVADALEDLADLLRLKGENRFRVAAVARAASHARDLEVGISSYVESGNLEVLPGIGKGIAREITSLVESGELEAVGHLKKEYPLGLLQVMRLPGLGPKKALVLWRELGVSSLSELEREVRAGRVRELKGFTRRSETAMLNAIETERRRPPAGEPIGQALPMAEGLAHALQECSAHVAGVEVTGELRQWRETIDRLQILIRSDSPAQALRDLRGLPQVADASWSEEGLKADVSLHVGLTAEVLFAGEEDGPWQLFCTTGDAKFLEALRARAAETNIAMGRRGWLTVGGDPLDAATQAASERELFEALSLSWIAPEQRTGWATPDLLRPRDSNRLISAAHLKGELHSHTTFSDGRNSLREMAEAARGRGYAYWAVTDHGLGHGFGDSLDAETLREQASQIDDLNEEYRQEGIDFVLLKGIEAEILADGSLGLDDDTLARLDVVVASIHGSLRQDAETITERCLKAVENPHVDILGHPTSRLVGARDPSALDVNRVLQACRDTGTAVEVNCNPARLDLRDRHAREAADLGCQLVLNCDAHSIADLEKLRYGIGTARRAGLTESDVLNARTAEAVLSFFERR